MKNILLFTQIYIMGLVFILSTSCSKVDTLPYLTTNEISSISKTSATCGGKITNDGGARITEKGVCWNTNGSLLAPTISDNKTVDGKRDKDFSSSISGLTPNTTYYVRAYATNKVGTNYGNMIIFTTAFDGGPIVFNPDITYGTMSDIDGNTYKTVTIGTQTWMAENLKVTKYNDNTEIQKVTETSSWGSITCGAYCNYGNEADNVSTFGQLYNWTAVNTGKLAPTGWHVASSAEWTILTNYLIANGYNYDGSTSGNLAGKSLASTTEWRETENIGTVSNDLASNNKSGFTGVPGGCRNSNPTTANPLGFGSIGDGAFWWTSSSDDRYVPQGQSGPDGFRCELYLVNAGPVINSCTKEWGLSVRCIKNN